MSYLSSLESDLRYWEGKVSVLNTTLKQLKKRKQDVEEAVKVLNSTAKNGACDVNSAIYDTKNALDDGIDYSERNSSINSIFANKLEQEAGIDSNLSAATSELYKELSDVNEKIDTCERDLAQAKANVSSTKAAISAEIRRMEEARAKEAERKAKEALSGIKLVFGNNNASGGDKQ